MTTVVVNGIDSVLGRRVAVAAADRLDVTVAASLAHLDPIDESRPDGEPLDVVILAPAHGPDLDGSRLGGVDLDGVERFLESIDGSGRPVRHAVVVSSAMVYGAWPSNPVPLTEDSALRPNPDAPFADDNAELERLTTEWAALSGAGLTVLRPTLTVGDDPEAIGWMERSLWHVPSARQGAADPPAQFLHLDDLVGGVVHALDVRPQGAFNVAPDGWLAAERQVSLAGKGGRIRVSDDLAHPLAVLRWRSRLTSTPPEILPWTMHSWVIANDRFRATGWSPTTTNDEAYVLANRPGWWASQHGRRRQEIALGAMIAAVLAVAIGLVVPARRRSRRRRAIR